jgi:hypothetical protein
MACALLVTLGGSLVRGPSRLAGQLSYSSYLSMSRCETLGIGQQLIKIAVI